MSVVCLCMLDTASMKTIWCFCLLPVHSVWEHSWYHRQKNAIVWMLAWSWELAEIDQSVAPSMSQGFFSLQTIVAFSVTLSWFYLKITGNRTLDGPNCRHAKCASRDVKSIDFGSEKTSCIFIRFNGKYSLPGSTDDFTKLGFLFMPFAFSDVEQLCSDSICASIRSTILNNQKDIFHKIHGGENSTEGSRWN